MNRCFKLGVASLVGIVLGFGAVTGQTTEPVAKDAKSFIPTRQYEALKGKSVGILVSKVQDVMARDGRGGPADAMGFSTNNKSYRWMYWPVSDNPLITNLQVKVGVKGDKTKVYPKLSMANAPLVKAKGIEVAYALVEVEVNDGQGAPAEEGFVATNMKRLDGSEKYPLKLPDVIADVEKRYKKHVEGQKKAIDKAMADVQKKVLKDRKVTGPKETKQVMYLTWLPDTQRVRIAMHTRMSDGAYTYVNGGIRRGPFPLPVPDAVPPKGGARPLALRPPPPPRDFKVKIGVTWGVELGMAYEVDVKGKVVATEELTIKSFSQELQPPPGGPRPRPGK